MHLSIFKVEFKSLHFSSYIKFSLIFIGGIGPYIIQNRSSDKFRDHFLLTLRLGYEPKLKPPTKDHLNNAACVFNNSRVS